VICIECRKPMQQTAMGAYVRCCHGIGYFWSDPPQPKDACFAAPHVRYPEGYIYRDWFKRITK